MCGSDSMKWRGILCFNLSRYRVDGRRGSDRPLGAVALGHQRAWLLLLHRTSWLELRSEPPRGVAAWVVQPKMMRGASGILTLHSTVVGNDSKVAVGVGSTFLASTTPHGLNRDPPAPRMGSQASLFSPQDPPLVQLLREAANWCLRCPLRVLGFDLKRVEIPALWPPIYRGFGLISKRIRSRRYFDPSIELVSTLVGINLKGKTPNVIWVWDELAWAANPGSVTLS
jgi:hypothetical protein